MSDGVDFSLVGMDELLGKLDAVKQDIKYKGGRFALRKAANLVAQKAKEGALRIDDPATAANIAKNIAVRWSGRFFKATGNLKFRVGVMGGAGGPKPSEYYEGNPGKDTRHWRYLEFGTSKMPAKPFMRPAMEQNIDKCVSVFVTEYNKSIDRALKRAQKKKAQQ